MRLILAVAAYMTINYPDVRGYDELSRVNVSAIWLLEHLTSQCDLQTRNKNGYNT